MQKTKVCVVGLGFIGCVHVENLRRLGNVEVVAVAAHHHARKKADLLCIEKAYENYQEMFDQEKPDAVHICTPNDTHYEIAMCAMQHGIHVLCEKPLAANLEQAQKLCAYAKEKGLICAVNFNFRFYPQILQMKQMVETGAVGRIFSVHGSYLQDWLLLEHDYNWRIEPDRSGASRAFADIGSHWIDAVENMIGSPVVEVLADFAIFHKTRRKPLRAGETFSGALQQPDNHAVVPVQTEDYACVVFHFSNGAHGCCVISQAYAGRKNQTIISVAGELCALHWDSEHSNMLWVGRRETYNAEVPKDPVLLLPKARAASCYPGGHVEGFADSMKLSFAAFYQAVSTNKKEAREFADFEDGVREMCICEAIVRSAQTGRWIPVKHTTEAN